MYTALLACSFQVCQYSGLPKLGAVLKLKYLIWKNFRPQTVPYDAFLQFLIFKARVKVYYTYC
jgi:hypothetical protein